MKTFRDNGMRVLMGPDANCTRTHPSRLWAIASVFTKTHGQAYTYTYTSRTNTNFFNSQPSVDTYSAISAHTRIFSLSLILISHNYNPHCAA